MHEGKVNEELPIVKANMRKAMRAGDIKLATGYGAILADLEVLRDKGVKHFIVYKNGTVEGIAA